MSYRRGAAALAVLAPIMAACGGTVAHQHSHPASSAAAAPAASAPPSPSPSPARAKPTGPTAHQRHLAHMRALAQQREAEAARSAAAAAPPSHSAGGSSLAGQACHTLTYQGGAPITSPGTYDSAGRCIAAPGPVHSHFTYGNAGTVRRPASSGEVQLCNVDPAQAKADGLACP